MGYRCIKVHTTVVSGAFSMMTKVVQPETARGVPIIALLPRSRLDAL
jgi:hypothetical protein